MTRQTSLPLRSPEVTGVFKCACVVALHAYTNQTTADSRHTTRLTCVNARRGSRQRCCVFLPVHVSTARALPLIAHSLSLLTGLQNLVCLSRVVFSYLMALMMSGRSCARGQLTGKSIQTRRGRHTCRHVSRQSSRGGQFHRDAHQSLTSRTQGSVSGAQTPSHGVQSAQREECVPCPGRGQDPWAHKVRASARALSV